MNNDDNRAKKFIEKSKWIFAKTYAKTAPHEYTLLKDTKDREDFFWFIEKILNDGTEEKFYRAFEPESPHPLGVG